MKRSQDFVNFIGINTHIDFTNAPSYAHLQDTINALKYLGIKNVRDSAEDQADIGAGGWWQQVANATGVKFDAYLSENDAVNMKADLTQRTVFLAQQGILNYIEGGNEEDVAKLNGLKNDLPTTANWQKTVYSTAHHYGLPAINMSFGAGWTPKNHYHGDYDKVGDLSAYCDYGNGHTYPIPPTLTPLFSINLINHDAKIAARTRPVITTEFGYYLSEIDTADPQASAAKYILDGLFDMSLRGDVKAYIYQLFDDPLHDIIDHVGVLFGIMANGVTPKPAGAAVHNLIALMSDPAANATSFSPTSLGYTISASKKLSSAEFEKADGTHVIAIWNEVIVPRANMAATLNLARTAKTIQVYDPLTGTGSIHTANNTGTVALSVPDHPILVFVGGGGTTGHDTPVVNVSGSLSVKVNATVAVTGVSITDPDAAANPGPMTLIVEANSGKLAMPGAAGSGTGSLKYDGSLAQINAALKNLAYTAPASPGSAKITFTPWNQWGNNSSKDEAVTITP